MKTKVYKATSNSYDENIIKEAAKVIRKGGFVALPTETVYGIAVNFEDKKAIKRLYEIKGREENKPVSIHLADFEDIDRYAYEVLPYAWRVMYEILPGPLTAVLKSKTKVTVGLRLPDCQITRSIIRRAAKTVVMPSANKSGKAPARSAEEALKDLDGLIDMLLDCGPTKLGTESTVVDFVSKEPKLLRKGAVDFNLIKKESAKKRILFVCTGNSCRSVMAHYLFKHQVVKKPGLEVESAGIGTIGGMKPTNETLDLLKNDGIDASGHAARRLDIRMLKEADLILVMGSGHEERVTSLFPEAKNKVYLLREFAKIKEADLDIPDPIGKSYDFYREVYYQIKEAILKIAEIV